MDAEPLIVILGPTASGKTEVALHLAREFNGEIIAADSRTIYKGMDIATAKPTRGELSQIRHHLIDIITPDQSFSVADFKRLAGDAIKDISGRKKVPIVVGGTGLYIDALIYDYSFRPAPNPDLRYELENLSIQELQNRIKSRSLPMPNNYQNQRHLIRTIESAGISPSRHRLRKNTLVIGLYKDPEALRRNIEKRVDAMISNGLIEEVRYLSALYGDVPAMQTPGYRAFIKYINDEITLDEARQLFIRADIQYSRRQRTWFKRNTDIIWISKMADSVELVTTFLSK